MRIKVHGGTARSDEPSLCLTCRQATVVKGQRARDELVACSQLETQITFRVESCSAYHRGGQPSLWHMESIAWILRTDPKRKQVGFVRSHDLRPGLRHVLDEE